MQRISNFFSKIKLFYFILSFIILNALSIRKIQRNQDRDKMYLLLKKFCKKLFKFYRVEIEVEGEIPNDFSNALYVANHQSIFDSLLMFSIIPNPVSFFIASEFEYMKKIPIVKTILSLSDNIYIDRKNVISGIRSLKKGISLLSKDVTNLIIFPEGKIKREQVGLEEECGAFLGGPFRTAMDNEKPVVLVTIKGSEFIHDDIFITTKINPGKVLVKINEPFYKKDYENFKPQYLADLCRDIVIKNLK